MTSSSSSSPPSSSSEQIEPAVALAVQDDAKPLSAAAYYAMTAASLAGVAVGSGLMMQYGALTAPNPTAPSDILQGLALGVAGFVIGKGSFMVAASCTGLDNVWDKIMDTPWGQRSAELFAKHDFFIPVSVTTIGLIAVTKTVDALGWQGLSTALQNPLATAACLAVGAVSLAASSTVSGLVDRLRQQRLESLRVDNQTLVTDIERFKETLPSFTAFSEPPSKKSP